MTNGETTHYAIIKRIFLPDNSYNYRNVAIEVGWMELIPSKPQTASARKRKHFKSDDSKSFADNPFRYSLLTVRLQTKNNHTQWIWGASLIPMNVLFIPVKLSCGANHLTNLYVLEFPNYLE